MAQLDSVTKILKGSKEWLKLRPNNNHLQGRITRNISTSHKSEILANLGNIIKDTEDYELIISSISKIIDHFQQMFPEGMPKAEIPDASTLQNLVTDPTNPNNVTIESFIFARLKRNMPNGFTTEERDGTLASYHPADKKININVNALQGSINSHIATNGKYNYKTTDDYIYCEFEGSVIHEFLHAISDNKTQIGFANYKASDQHLGINESTTEKIASMIENPRNYRKTNITILKTKRAQFLTNVDSNSGYSYHGIVNLVGMLTGIEQDSKKIQKQYILGKPPVPTISQNIVEHIDTIYKFSEERNPIQQANLYYTQSMDNYYEAIGISKTSKASVIKTITISYVDDRNVAHNIPVNCYIYPGDIYRYEIPNNSVITEDMLHATFGDKHIQNQPAGINGGKSAVARFITGYLNTNNVSPYNSIRVSHLDIQGQPATWRYLMSSKTQDEISSVLFKDISQDIANLQTNFEVSKFYEILKRINAIGDNIVYSIPNDTTKYNLRNIGYVGRLVNRPNSTLPIKTITHYYNLRKSLLSLAKANESKFGNTVLNTIINIYGVDMVFEKNSSGLYTLSKRQPNLNALIAKMKKYPILASVQAKDTNYYMTIVEDIVNKGIGFGDLDDFSNKYLEKTQITYQTICYYLQNEKFKQKDYIVTSNIIFSYNGVDVNKFIPIKITTQDKNKLQLAQSTLTEIQSSLKTPYALSELNALIGAYLVPKFNANISDFTINCDLQSPHFEKHLQGSKKDRFIKVGGDTIAISLNILQDVCVIGNNVPNSLDSHIEKYLTTSKFAGLYSSSKDKAKFVETIRKRLNLYIHSNNLNDRLKETTKSKPLVIDIAKMVDYVMSVSPELTQAQQQKPNPSGNGPNTNPNGNNPNPNGNNGNNTQQPKFVSPYDYFSQYFDKDGKFKFTPYTAWGNMTMNANYYNMMFQQYQFMQYYSYMMNFYGGYQNYPMIQQMNMGNIYMPGSIMYGMMPQMYGPIMMPYVFNGYNNFYGYNAYMQGGFNPNTMPFYKTSNGVATQTTLDINQINSIKSMISNIPTNPTNVTETVKSLQTLKSQLDVLIAKYGKELTNPDTPTTPKGNEEKTM
ncbi:MAG: hypothetical protein IJW28_04690 [Clostridia bacterium]|nr:hypothetical protein [Clostridia bacterium]